MSVTARWPDHLLTLEEWDQLPDELCRRGELIEGVLLVVPSPAALHQRAMAKLCAALNLLLPHEYSAVPDIDVIVELQPLPTVRKPDVVVLRTELVERNPTHLTASDVLLAIEIVSPGSGRTDRVMKMAEYAAAGIKHYWIIELGPPVSMAPTCCPPLARPTPPTSPGRACSTSPSHSV